MDNDLENKEITEENSEDKKADENTKKKKPFDMNIVIAILAASILEDLVKYLFKIKADSQYNLLILAAFYIVIYSLLKLINKKKNEKY